MYKITIKTDDTTENILSTTVTGDEYATINKILSNYIDCGVEKTFKVYKDEEPEITFTLHANRRKEYKKCVQYLFETKFINDQIVIKVLDIDEGRREVATITNRDLPETIPEMCNFLNKLFWRLR